MSTYSSRIIFSFRNCILTATTTPIRKWCSTTGIPPITTHMPIIRRKAKGEIEQSAPFVDKKLVVVQGGKGGDGAIAFSRLFGNEFAGPDGGDGGSGGHIVLQASGSTKSLVHIPSKICGELGVRGGSQNCTGKNGEHLTFLVPLGTMVKTPPPNPTLIADLSCESEFFIAAKGGGGGKGNKFFASAQNQSPELAEFGGEGEINTLLLEMSIIADFGLVGFPNAGKSTLLRAISRARPKVASYAFTTLKPHVGVVFFEDMGRVTVADIPGLIPDAHKNRGLGISFLRHIQRCLCLVYVIDFSQPDPVEQYEALHNELEHYDAQMVQKKFVILANKLDTAEARENYKQFKTKFTQEVLPVSAKFSIGLKELLQKLRIISDQEKKPENTEEIYKPVQDSYINKWR